jgi:hypothetical protein
MKSILALALMISQLAVAGELVVFEKQVMSLPRFDDTNTAFQVDGNSEGYIRLVGTRRVRGTRCTGPVMDRDCMNDDYDMSVFEEKVLVPNLSLEVDKLIYRGPMGAIECATLGRSRVLRRPTLFMSGACQAKTAIVKIDGLSYLQLKFITQD